MGFNLGRVAYAASELANKWIDEESRANRERALEELRHANQIHLDQYQNSPERRSLMRVERNKDLEAESDAKVSALLKERSAPVVDAQIAAENRLTAGTAQAKAGAVGLVERARAENSPFELAPGQQRYVGGAKVAENARLTNGEISGELYREGLKSSGGAKVERMSEAGRIQLKDLGDAERDLDKIWTTATMNDSSIKQDASDPRFAAYAKAKQSIVVQRMRLLAQEGAISGAEDARRAVEGETSPEVIQRARRQAQSIGGQYAKDATAVFDDALQRMGSPDAKRAAIEADMARTGTKDALIDINGQRSSVGNTLWATEDKRRERDRKKNPIAADESATGKALAAARTELREAQADLQRYGSRQRASDPGGFASARSRYQAAQAAVRDAEMEYADDGSAIPTMLPTP